MIFWLSAKAGLLFILRLAGIIFPAILVNWPVNKSIFFRFPVKGSGGKLWIILISKS
jgi:hypothetical protein